MSDMERVTIALPSKMAQSMRTAVEAGEYATTSEVVRDALRLWESRRDLRAQALAGLQRAWGEGKASGRPRPLDIDSVIARGERKLGAPE